VLENYKGDDPTITTTARQKYNKLGTAPTMNNTTNKGGNLLDMDERN
jgi:hypothetical protein